MSQPATISLVPLNSLPSNARQIPLSFLPLPVGRTLSSSPPSPSSLKFSSKVVSRQHAIMGYTDGKLWIQDTKSSSGTFVNSRRLSPQGVESAKTELCDGDVIRLGEDCEVNGVIHNAVIVKLVLSPSSSAAGHYRHPHYQQQQQTFFPQHQLQESLQHLDPQTTTSSLESIHEKNAYWREKEHEKDREYIDFSLHPQVLASVDAEYRYIWTSLTEGLDHPLKKLKELAYHHSTTTPPSLPPVDPTTTTTTTNTSPTPHDSTIPSHRPSLPRADTALPTNVVSPTSNMGMGMGGLFSSLSSTNINTPSTLSTASSPASSIRSRHQSLLHGLAPPFDGMTYHSVSDTKDAISGPMTTSTTSLNNQTSDTQPQSSSTEESATHQRDRQRLTLSTSSETTNTTDTTIASVNSVVSGLSGVRTLTGDQ